MNEDKDNSKEANGISVSFWAKLPITARTLLIVAGLAGVGGFSSDIRSILLPEYYAADCADEGELRKLRTLRNRYEDRIMAFEDWATAKDTALTERQIRSLEEQVYATTGFPKSFATGGHE